MALTTSGLENPPGLVGLFFPNPVNNSHQRVLQITVLAVVQTIPYIIFPSQLCSQKVSVEGNPGSETMLRE